MAQNVREKCSVIPTLLTIKFHSKYSDIVILKCLLDGYRFIYTDVATKTVNLMVNFFVCDAIS